MIKIHLEFTLQDTNEVDAGSAHEGHTLSMSQAVVCASMNVHFFEDGQPNLQYDIQYAPKFDAPLLDSVGKLLQHVPLDRHIPKFDSEDPEEDDCISEVRHFNLRLDVLILLSFKKNHESRCYQISSGKFVLFLIILLTSY